MVEDGKTLKVRIITSTEQIYLYAPLELQPQFARLDDGDWIRAFGELYFVGGTAHRQQEAGFSLYYDGWSPDLNQDAYEAAYGGGLDDEDEDEYEEEEEEDDGLFDPAEHGYYGGYESYDDEY